MPIDPNIALSFRGMQLESPLAQYGQVANIQSAQNQNALAQYQIAAAQREQEATNAINDAYAKAYDPRTGKIDRGLLRENMAKSNFGSKLPGIEKTLTEIEKQQLEADKLKGEITAQPTTLAKNKTELVDAKLKQSRVFLDTIDPSDPTAPAKYLAWHQANHADPIIGPELAARGVTAEQSRAQIDAAIAKGPQAFADLLNRSKLGTEKFIELNKPTVTTQNLGGTERLLQTPGLGGEATIVPGSIVARTMTPGEAAMLPIHQGQLGVSQGQLGVARSGLGIRAYEADPFNMGGLQSKFPVNGLAQPVAPRNNLAVNPALPSARSAAPAVNPAAQVINPAAPVAKPNAQTLGNTKMGLADAINSGVQGNDLLAYMPKALAAQVTAITDHRAAPPDRVTNRGSQITQLVQLVDPTYDATSYKTKQGTETAFTSGRLGTTARSFNVVNEHLATLGQLSDALQNNDVQLINKVGNFFATQTGGTAPTNFDAAKRIVADEVTKAVLGSGGALGDRKAVDDAISNAKSPQQLKEVIQTYQKLIDGQLNGFRQQYKSGGGAKNFDVDILGRTPAPATTASTAIPQKAIDALKAGKGTDEQFDAIFGAGAAKRARGGK